MSRISQFQLRYHGGEEFHEAKYNKKQSYYVTLRGQEVLSEFDSSLVP